MPHQCKQVICRLWRGRDVWSKSSVGMSADAAGKSACATELRGSGSPALAAAITLGIALLLGGIQIFQIAPEDLILGVFDVVKAVFLYGKDEDAHGGQRHREAGQDGNPGQFHRASSIPTMVGRREIATCCARKEMVAPLSTSTSAPCASAQTPWAGHQAWRGQAWALGRKKTNKMVTPLSTSTSAPCASAQTPWARHQAWRVQAWSLVRHTLSRMGPSTASTTSRTDAVRCNSSNSNPPVLPRWEITRPARVRFCSTLHRNCSGHSAIADSSERLSQRLWLVAYKSNRSLFIRLAHSAI